MDTLNSQSDFQQRLPSNDLPEISSSSDPSARQTISDEDLLAHASFLRPKRRAGRLKFRETRHPFYRGVRRRNADKWVCEVREPNKKSRIWLGTFPTPEMAARAHDVAVLALRGPSAGLNFADSARLLPRPVSKSAKDIQRAAAEAAEAFRPQPEPDTQRIEQERLAISPENVFFLDEEFGMHSLLLNMAEGLLLSPPSVGSGVQLDDVDSYVELPLWSFSI